MTLSIMKKVHSNRYPERGQKQHGDISKALITMLNCRRYLASQGFGEMFLGHDYDKNVNGIEGKILFPDGSEVGNKSFCMTKDTNSRDALMERIISKDAKFYRKKSDYDGYDRSRIVRTSHTGEGYCFRLFIRDTSKESLVFPLSLLFYNARNFAFQYYIILEKDVIKDSDLEEFAKYRQSLDDVIRQEALITYTTQVPQGKYARTQEVESTQVETHLINLIL